MIFELLVDSIMNLSSSRVGEDALAIATSPCPDPDQGAGDAQYHNSRYVPGGGGFVSTISTPCILCDHCLAWTGQRSRFS